MRGRTTTTSLATAVLLAALTVPAGPLAFATSAGDDPEPPIGRIPTGPGRPAVPPYLGGPATPRPFPGRPVPANPHMARPGFAAMHADSYASDAHPFPGPLGRGPRVVSVAKAAGGLLPGLCSTVTFARGSGLIVAQCTYGQTFRLRLIDPVTLRDLASHDLPPRPSTVDAAYSLDLDKVFTDTSGGAYFYLDRQDRVVLADSAFHVRRFAHERTGRGGAGGWRFAVTDDWDLAPYVPHDCPTWNRPKPVGECDPVTSVGPDWHGLIWWVTRHGRVGTIDPATGAVRSIRFPGEGIQNSFAAAETGVSVVTDHALYLLRAGRDGVPRVVWRQVYDRGTGRKPGQIDQGSGTTPTLLGTEYVAITDNADDRMHVLVHRRDDGRPVCRVPVFGHGASATDNSLIGYGRSLFVENNFGYRDFVRLPPGGSVVGGVARIDVEPARAHGPGTAGTPRCRTVWTSAERSPSTVAKLSVPSGLLYLYTKEPRPDLIDAWYLTAVDARTGRTVFKVLTGTGKWFDNDWAPVTLGPDGTAYVGVVGGLVAVRDRDRG